MADNRLYIYDPDTNKAVFIAKNNMSGWYISTYYSEGNHLAKSLDKFFENLDKNKGFGDNNGTELKLVVENELPKNIEIISD